MADLDLEALEELMKVKSYPIKANLCIYSKRKKLNRLQRVKAIETGMGRMGTSQRGLALAATVRRRSLINTNISIRNIESPLPKTPGANLKVTRRRMKRKRRWWTLKRNRKKL